MSPDDRSGMQRHWAATSVSAAFPVKSPAARGAGSSAALEAVSAAGPEDAMLALDHPLMRNIAFLRLGG